VGGGYWTVDIVLLIQIEGGHCGRPSERVSGAIVYEETKEVTKQLQTRGIIT
jgi:hypothetical protein